MPDVHALLSASAAERWMNCPGSVAATKDLPDTGSTYAAEGTLCHSLCELKLRKLFSIPTPMPRAEYQAMLAEIKADALWQEEMDACSDTYVEHIQETMIQYPARPAIAVEQRVDFSEYVPGGFGTSDCILLTPNTIHVIDYKHGKGVPVSAVENKQLRLYALGAILKYRAIYSNIKYVVLHVVQPRLDNISVWQTQIEDLMMWAETEVRPAAKRALDPDAPCVPGDSQCRFCGIRDRCRARAEGVKAAAASPLYNKFPPVLTDTEVGEALTLAKGVADWLKKLESYAVKTLESGGAIPGYKLVEGRRVRTWDDQTAAFIDIASKGIDEALLYERKPLTVAQLETVVGKKVYAQIVAPHVTVSPGKPTLVPESDNRKPWSAAKADFADILKNKGE